MITVEALRKELGGRTDIDADLSTLRLSAIKQWERDTGLLWLAREGYEETLLNLDVGATSLWLGLRPVTEITSVEERFAGYSEFTEVDEDAYVIEGYRLERVDGASWAPSVRVTYDGGYDAESCPADIQEALLKLVSFSVGRWGRDRIVAKGSSGKGGGVLYATECEPFAMAVRAHVRKA